MPTKTLKRLDKVTPKGGRSEFINEVVNKYLTDLGKKTLREQLKEEAIAFKDINLKIAREWALIEPEWPE